MLLGYVFVEVVILVNEVIAWEGRLQEIISDDEEVELKLEAIAFIVLLVDVALIVLTHIVSFDPRSLRCLSSSYSLDLCLEACGSS